MAETKRDSEAKARADDAPKASDSDEVTFPVAQLIADASPMLGYQSYEAAGGLYGVEGELAISDAKARIAAWLKKEA